MTLLTNDTEKRSYLDMLVNLVAEKVAITKSMYDSAISQYNGITHALDVPELAPYQPVLRIQGSMRLGTSVRSYLNEDDFDVDIIIELRKIPIGWTQQRVKDLILQHLLNHHVYGNMIKDKKGGRRCVTVIYANNSHVDVLPCVVSDTYVRAIEMRSQDISSYLLDITDKKHPGYTTEENRSKWYHSNPIGYADWFHTIAVKYETKHKSALMVRAEIEKFPSYKEPYDKNILQKIIMLLKRHRDMMMGDDEDKPVSILLTTLATKAYDKAPIAGIFATLCWVAEHMNEEILNQCGKLVVLNPANPLENFADKWLEKPRKQEQYFKWYNQLVADIQSIQQLEGSAFINKLKQMFGEKAVINAREEEGKRVHKSIRSKELAMGSNGCWREGEGKTTKPHTFYEE